MKQVSVALFAFLFTVLCLSVQAQESMKQVQFRFVAGEDMFFLAEGDNAANLQRLTKFIEANKDVLAGGAFITVNGHCASKGYDKTRRARCKVMCNRVKTEMILRCGMKEENFTTRNYVHSSKGTPNVVTVDISLPQVEPVAKETTVEPAVVEEKKEEPKEEPKVEPKEEAQPAPQAVAEPETFSRWNVGANVGIPFFWGDMVSFSEDKTYIGFAVGLQGSYRFSRLLSLTLSADYAQGKTGARDYAVDYLLSPSGMTYYTPQSTTTAKYNDLYSKISLVNIGLGVDVNINRIFSKNCEHHFLTLLVSPTVYGQFFSADVYKKTDDSKFSDGTTKPKSLSLGLGGAVSLRFRLSRALNLQLKNTVIWITDNKFDAVVTPWGKTKHNAMWMPQIGMVWNIGK